MNGGRRIISLDGAATDADEQSNFGAAAPDDSLLLSPDPGIATLRDSDQPSPEHDGEPWLAETDGPDEPPRRNYEWAAPALGGLAIAIWTGFFAWAVVLNQREPIAPDQWAWWITQWSVPVLLVLVTLLLVIRTSRREAGRFADVALSLSRESHALEKRLVSINTELSLARDFIASQGRDLETLGRVAVERLSSSSARLDELVGRNGAQVDRIADVSAAALDNMDKLRGQLPVIANAAKDVTNNIGNAGRTAHLQLEELVSGFQRLNEFGLASERQVASVRERIETAVTEFAKSSESLADMAEERFEALSRSSAEQAGLVQQSEQAALAAWRERSDAHVAALSETLARFAVDHQALLAQSREQLGRFEDAARSLNAELAQEARSLDDELARRRVSVETQAANQRSALDQRLGEIDTAIAARRATMEKAAASAAESLATKLAELDLAIDAQRKLQVAEADALAVRFAEIGQKVSTFTALLSKSGEEGVLAAVTIDTSIDGLTNRLAEMRHALSGTDLEIGELTDSAVRLLELIQAGGDHTRTQIPEALRSTEAGLKGLEDRVFTLRDTLREASDGGRDLSTVVSDARAEVSTTISELRQAHKLLVTEAEDREARIAALRDLLAAAQRESAELSTDIEQRLTSAVGKLTDAAAKAGEDLRTSTANEVEAVAERLGEHSSAAIARVLQGRAAELIGRLEEAIDAAADASRETAIRMRDQLTKVDELAGNLEARVSRAREKAEEQVNNDFARRAALITESLNSSAIDIAKALSSDVSETAWASYLRGDRGIFTRRAVTLLESADAKAVQSHYEGDGEFREHVNRYIHDFESMLRQLLSTRDGNALGVTLLSSDMGKLYVALAQGIERLRT